jgi:Ca-activated chloride channel family protein
MVPAVPIFLADGFPLELEYLSWPLALLLLAGLSTFIVLLGMRALTGMSAARRWVAISIRLLVVVLLLVLIGGPRWKRVSKDLEVVVMRDISPSVGNVVEFPGPTLQSSLDKYISDAGKTKKPDADLYGQISFDDRALIDVLPSATPTIYSRAIRHVGQGTNIAAAIQLGLATFGHNMRRLVLISDGNPTQGDTDAAVDAAVAQHVPIDVMPLHYDIQHEVMLDKIVAPTWRHEKEPFTLDIYVKSTNDFPVTGKLMVTDQGVPMDLDLATPGIQTTRDVTLPAGSTDHPAQVLVQVKVPAQESAGVHQFHASFDTDQPGAKVSVGGNNAVDTLTANNVGDAFTYVQGKGRILYVDGVENGGGQFLRNALNEEGVHIADDDHITPSQFPSTLIQLQDFDAVILANVRYGGDGLNDQQQSNLATYVHDMGGGLVMIGGPDTFGAGGWQGKALADVLPVGMEIPAIRKIPKGALVLAMDSAEAPEGNYWGMQCAIKASEALSSQDDIGIVSYGQSGCAWDLPLGPKGDGSKVISAVKNWWMGDLPSFENAVNLAIDGDSTSPGLLADNAASKHIIIITDDDPQMPSPQTIERLKKAKISVSTITVFPHSPHNIAPGTLELAKLTGGRSFGPIEDHPDQLPQIFVKEATVVRRSLIEENEEGIPVTRRPVNSDMTKGISSFPKIRGMVITSKKPNPQIVIPIVAGKSSDPLLASWQTGLGKAVVYTSDANDKWGNWWLSSPDYNKFWAQVVRGVARPPMSNKFDVSITQDGTHGHIVVEGRDKDTGFMNFLNVGGKVVGPDSTKQPMDEHLVQTGPGRYEGDFDMSDAGTYVAVMQYRDQDGNTGFLPVSGLSMNSSPEMRDLHSNDARLEDIARRTRGRVLPAFDVEDADLFSRENLAPAISSLPIWEQLIPWVLAMILIDVAARRIAWDWKAIQRYAATSTGFIRSFTTTRQVETRESLDALKRVKAEGETKAKSPPTIARPDPKAKFQATGIEGDISTIVGGATDKPIPSAPKKIEPKGVQSGGGMSNLMEAKRRAQQQIKDREKGDS